MIKKREEGFMKKKRVMSLAVLMTIFLTIGLVYAADPEEIRIGSCESVTGMFAGFSAVRPALIAGPF